MWSLPETDSVGVQFLLPKVESMQYVLPDQCILRPEADRHATANMPDMAATSFWLDGVPRGCQPWSTGVSDNRYWPAERGKQKGRRGQWRCGECGKLFHAEHFLDRHVQRTHLADLVPPVRT